MVSHEENPLLTQTSAGTPMGEYFRRYWLPAMLSTELPVPDEVARALGNLKALLLKNHGCVVAGPGVPDVCVTAFGLEKVAETMLRAASIARLPVMSAEAKAVVMASRKAASAGNCERQNAERWQMLQDYYGRGVL